MPLVFGSCRASTSKQVMSTDAQMHAIKAWFDYQKSLGEGLEWGDFFIDKATTSKIPWNERTYGALLNARLQKGDIVVAAKLDRMFRNAREALNMIEDFQIRGIRLVLLDISVDTSRPEGKLFFTMMAAFAEWERSRISERTREGLAARKAMGLPHSRETQLGWKVGIRLGKKFLTPDYPKIEFAYACHFLRERHGIPEGDICLAAHVAGKTKLCRDELRRWNIGRHKDFALHNGRTPFQDPALKERTMRNAEVIAEKLFNEVLRRKGFWAKRHLAALRPCLSTTSP